MAVMPLGATLLSEHGCTLFSQNIQTVPVLSFIVFTGGIRWILWFSVRYAAAVRRAIFGVNALRGKLHQLGSPNLQDIFIGG